MASDTEAAPNGAMDLVVKSNHQHSNSEIAKLNIPMYVTPAIARTLSWDILQPSSPPKVRWS